MLKALDDAAISLRGKLGESLSSVQKYATPLEEATTPSLEALKAYSLGLKTMFAKGADGCFAILQASGGTRSEFCHGLHLSWRMCYSDLNETGRAAENARKAYDLREKGERTGAVLHRRNLLPDATGELEKAAQAYELWQQTYPRDSVPYASLAAIYRHLGNWEKALEESPRGHAPRAEQRE